MVVIVFGDIPPNVGKLLDGSDHIEVKEPTADGRLCICFDRVPEHFSDPARTLLVVSRRDRSSRALPRALPRCTLSLFVSLLSRPRTVLNLGHMVTSLESRDHHRAKDVLAALEVCLRNLAERRGSSSSSSSISSSTSNDRFGRASGYHGGAGGAGVTETIGATDAEISLEMAQVLETALPLPPSLSLVSFAPAKQLQKDVSAPSVTLAPSAGLGAQEAGEESSLNLHALSSAMAERAVVGIAAGTFGELLAFACKGDQVSLWAIPGGEREVASLVAATGASPIEAAVQAAQDPARIFSAQAALPLHLQHGNLGQPQLQPQPTPSKKQQAQQLRFTLVHGALPEPASSPIDMDSLKASIAKLPASRDALAKLIAPHIEKCLLYGQRQEVEAMRAAIQEFADTEREREEREELAAINPTVTVTLRKRKKPANPALLAAEELLVSFFEP